MTKSTRARYTLEFKAEAVRLVTGGERVATVARNLGLSEQTLHNWVKRLSKEWGRCPGQAMTSRMFQRLGNEDEVDFALGRNGIGRFEPQCRRTRNHESE